MTAATPHNRELSAVAPVTCAADGGCSYLRALSTIERLAGFDQTAHSYETAASRCQYRGCWAAEIGPGRASLRPDAAPPVPLEPIRPARNPGASSTDGGAIAPIPFIRAAMVDGVSDSDGNYVERRPLKLGTLSGSGDPLGYLYRYWCGLRAETECRFANIDTIQLIRSGIIGSMHVVDVSTGDPDDFRFELSGYAISLGPFEKPKALPVPIYADTTIHDYNTVRLTGVPRLQRVRARLGDTSHRYTRLILHYTRLILPFFNTRGTVDRLVIGIRQEPGNGVKRRSRD